MYTDIPGQIFSNFTICFLNYLQIFQCKSRCPNQLNDVWDDRMFFLCMRKTSFLWSISSLWRSCSPVIITWLTTLCKKRLWEFIYSMLMCTLADARSAETITWLAMCCGEKLREFICCSVNISWFYIICNYYLISARKNYENFLFKFV